MIAYYFSRVTLTFFRSRYLDVSFRFLCDCLHVENTILLMAMSILFSKILLTILVRPFKEKWSRLSDLNRRPAVYKTAALPLS